MDDSPENSRCTAESRQSACRRDIALVIFLALVITATALILIRTAQERSLRASTTSKIFFIRHHLKDELKDEALLMEGLLDFIARDDRLVDAWKRQDRELLAQRAIPLFESLRNRHGISHFYFIEPDRVCFFRAHNPGRHDDVVGRLTLDIAFHSGKTSSGVELGRFGKLVLRVVRPWVIEGKVAGYLELGEEVDRIFEQITWLLEMDLILAIDKKSLDRKNWEEGMSVSGRQGDWDRYRNVVVASSTIKNLSSNMGALVDNADLEKTFFTVASQGKTYHGGFDRLSDVGGNYVGKYVILSDVTEQKRGNSMFLWSAAGVLFLVAATFCLGRKIRLRRER